MTQPTFSLDQISDLVSRQVNEILGKRGGLPFTQDERDRLETVDAQVQGLLMDTNLGRVMSGPTWMSGISVIDGSITAEKITVNDLEALQVATGSLNVTGTITAAASFPAVAARITISSSGIYGYQSDGATTTFKLNVDGSGEIGSVPGSRISWTSGGVLTVPAAIISSLTIASVTSGTLGGTYSTSGSNPRIQFSTSGIVVTNSGGTTTFQLDASTGAMTATGSFTVKSTATGAHITISNAGGIAGYNNTTESAGNRTFLINATDGSGHLGISGITWDGSGNVTIPGGLLVNGSVTAGKISVSNLAAIDADLGTITAGTINASLITVSNLSFTNIQQTGTLGAAQNLGTNNITVNSTGKILFGSGDYLANDVLHFEVTSSESGKIEFVDTGITPKTTIRASASASGASSALYTQYDSGSSDNVTFGLNVTSTNSIATVAAMQGGVSSSITVTDGTTDEIVFNIHGNNVAAMESSNRRLSLYGYLYPGTGSAFQTTGYISWTDTTTDRLSVIVNGNESYFDTAGRFVSAGNIFPGFQTNQYVGYASSYLVLNGPIDIANSTEAGSTANWSTGLLGADTSYVKIKINGTLRRIPVYADG